MTEKDIVQYYVLCNKLKQTLRTGWLQTHITKERIESVAEHIYSTQMLALAMYSQYQYKIDIYKVILMLAIHETEEIIIGDLTYLQIDELTKQEIGHKAIHEVLENLNIKEDLIDLILEFDAKETEEAKFAYYCDKLECDLQCKLYCEKENNLSLAEKWIKNDLNKINYDDNFASVAKYALNNNLEK
ncbi:MAG: HD domain-containing protein [Erysipelotrichia bacterium]|nr:HD domain-containing protein [Erysipelotrichia bacterium]